MSYKVKDAVVRTLMDQMRQAHRRELTSKEKQKVEKDATDSMRRVHSEKK